MPQSIPKGITHEHVLRAIADLGAGVEHPFGASTGYELVHEGRRYLPKAVIGLACRHLAGRLLRPEEFSGGEAPGQADHLLETTHTMAGKTTGNLVGADADEQTYHPSNELRIANSITSRFPFRIV